MSIVFVHGTGVRAPAYAQTFSMVEEKLGAYNRAWRACRCCWGDECGARLRGLGASIPDYATARTIDGLQAEDESMALWAMLYADPLYELRLLTAQEEAEPLPPGQEPPSLELKQRIDGLPLPEPLRETLVRNRLDYIWPEAFHAVIGSAVFEDAVQTVTPTSDHSAATARAVVAEAITRAEEQGIPSVNGAIRDEMVRLLASAWSGDHRGITSRVVGLAASFATRRATRRRGALSDTGSPIAGDILLYQTRGEEIRHFIRNMATSLDDSIVLLAHSLGGVACVDLLAMTPLPGVRGLITVGSQAAFLYEIDSLTSIRYRDDLPPHFPRWLNFYDRNDFLSFMAEPLFPNKAVDVEVKSRQPFPKSHSAYWSDPGFWKQVAVFLR